MRGHRQNGVVMMGVAMAGALSIIPTSGCAASSQGVRLTDQQRALNVESFEYVWSRIRDTHFDPTLGGLDWDTIHDELAPKVEKAETMSQARAVMSDLVSRLELTHFAIIPSSAYNDIADESSQFDEHDDEDGSSDKDGWTGIDLRVIEGRAIVTSVFAESPADLAGVRPGWEIGEINDQPVTDKIERASREYDGKTLKDLVMSRAVSSRLNGRVGESVKIVFRDAHDELVTLEMNLVIQRGRRIQFGHLPPTFAWIETHPVDGDIGYIAFNGFFDPNHLMTEFNEAILKFMDHSGLIIDLRGNPGGIGAMSMGMAGWLIDSRQYLGTLQLRDSELKFVVNPRAETYNGPLAIVVDGLSASTAEIFAGGLKDIGRAQVIGSRTAGAALPSVIERLPNGDGFQYARANYVSFGGQALEGNGVTPDIEIAPTRQSLLAGRDLMIEAAIAWIRKQD